MCLYADKLIGERVRVSGRVADTPARDVVVACCSVGVKKHFSAGFSLSVRR